MLTKDTLVYSKTHKGTYVLYFIDFEEYFAVIVVDGAKVIVSINDIEETEESQ